MQIKSKIEDKFIDLLRKESAICMVLNGKWGVGKTYFWQKFAYISLFGKDDIKQIKQEIILRAYRISRTISEISKNAKKLRFDKILDEVTPKLGSAIIECISFFEKKDFEDIVICFDDFERLSNKLNLKDIFGLISEIKEQKNCHIVMIFNAGELILDNDTKKQKDKIIDYEFEYNPSMRRFI